MTLVAKDHRWLVESEKIQGDGSVISPCALVIRHDADYCIDDLTHARTPAIALCIAALRDRSKTEGE